MNIPSYIKKNLWDTPVENLDLNKHYKYITERVLEYADFQGFRWLEEKYGKEKIVDVLKNSRKISAKTGNFFAVVYSIGKEEMRCLTHPFTQKQNRF